MTEVAEQVSLWWEVIKMIFQSFPFTFVHFLFWLVLLLVYTQYKRSIRLEQQLFGRAKNNPKKLTLISLGCGVLAGLLASLLLVFLGISIIDVGILYVWPLLIFLLLFHPRYMCFAYAGGIVSLISLMLNAVAAYQPAILEIGLLAGIADMNVPGLMAIVGILHLTESILIYLSGHIGPSPIYLKHRNNGVVGGFSLQKFWPLPIVGLWAMGVPEGAAGAEAVISMPDWWPLVGGAPDPGEGEKLVYSMFPLVAGLGYGDMSVASDPKEKSKRSAFFLFIYSVILIAVSVGSAFVSPLMWVAALIAPIGHEALIVLGNAIEFSRDPIYSQGGRGLKILDIMPGSLADQMGLSPGDIILHVNEIPVNSKEDLTTSVYQVQPYVRLNVETSKGDPKLVKAPLYENHTHLGIIPVPDPYDTSTAYVSFSSQNPIEKLTRKVKGLFGQNKPR